MKEILVQSLSNSDRTAFLENEANRFKNHLPYSLRFQERGWKVGLASMLMPCVPVPITIKDDLCRIAWTLGEDLDPAMYSTEGMTIKPKDVRAHRWKVTSGMSLMQFILDRFRDRLGKDLIESDLRLKDHQDGKQYYPVFRWEGKELVIDNMHTFTNKDFFRSRTEVIFGHQLALDMGWVCYREDLKYYVVRPNLIKEIPSNIVPFANDMKNPQKDRTDLFSKFDDDGLKISCFCNWRFTSLDQVFENTFGSS